MAIQCIHASKSPLTTIASIRPDVQMQLFVSFTVVLSGETLVTTGPFTFERPFLVMRA